MSKIKVSAGLLSSKASVQGLQSTDFSLGLHMVLALCGSVPYSLLVRQQLCWTRAHPHDLILPSLPL